MLNRTCAHARKQKADQRTHQQVVAPALGRVVPQEGAQPRTPLISRGARHRLARRALCRIFLRNFVPEGQREGAVLGVRLLESQCALGREQRVRSAAERFQRRGLARPALGPLGLVRNGLLRRLQRVGVPAHLQKAERAVRVRQVCDGRSACGFRRAFVARARTRPVAAPEALVALEPLPLGRLRRPPRVCVSHAYAPRI